MGNTVGSLTSTQKSLVTGTLLGDGYMRIVPGRKNAFLEINHSSKQKEYVNWKYFQLQNFVNSPPKMRTFANREAFRFSTKSSPEFTEIYRMFYIKGKKIIPDLTLDPLSLAVWYMDDGSKVSESDFYLNTQKFSMQDQLKLLWLLKNIGLDAKLNRDKEYFRIRFLKKSLSKLKQIINPDVIPYMRYKL